MTDPTRMLDNLAGQTLSLAHVAALKFKAAGLATAALLLAVLLGAVAAIAKAW